MSTWTKTDVRNHVWAQVGLTPPQRLVAFALAEYFNENTQTAWPSYAHLAAMTGLAEKTVAAACKALCRAGAGWTRTETRGQGFTYVPVITAQPAPAAARVKATMAVQPASRVAADAEALAEAQAVAAAIQAVETVNRDHAPAPAPLATVTALPTAPATLLPVAPAPVTAPAHLDRHQSGADRAAARIATRVTEQARGMVDTRKINRLARQALMNGYGEDRILAVLLQIHHEGRLGYLNAESLGAALEGKRNSGPAGRPQMPRAVNTSRPPGVYVEAL